MMNEIYFTMSNFDGSIDKGMEKSLRDKPNKVFGRHAGWNFNGRVYFNGDKFCEDVYCYGSMIATIKHETLRGLFNEVCNAYGCE